MGFTMSGGTRSQTQSQQTLKLMTLVPFLPFSGWAPSSVCAGSPPPAPLSCFHSTNRRCYSLSWDLGVGDWMEDLGWKQSPGTPHHFLPNWGTGIVGSHLSLKGLLIRAVIVVQLRCQRSRERPRDGRLEERFDELFTLAYQVPALQWNCFEVLSSVL